MTATLQQPTRVERWADPHRWWRGVGLGVGALLLAVALAGVERHARDNFHQVVHHEAYRCGQLAPTALRDRLRLHRIRSIVNLRGPNPDQQWYQEEQAVSAKAQVCVLDIAMSSSGAPTSGELRELVRIFATCPKPVLIHCESGLDRTGLASAIYLLAVVDCTIEKAQQQLGLRYGMPPGRERTRCYLQFLGQYQRWLDEQELAHSKEHFFLWALHVYQRPESLGGPDWPVYGCLR